MEQCKLAWPWMLFCLLATQARAAPKPGLWPLPRSVELFPHLFFLSRQEFKINFGSSSKVGPSCIILQEAFRR